MGSWRIESLFVDKANTVGTPAGVFGGTVIVAPKGPKKPIMISRGSEQRILDIFGYPNATYPQIQDAIDYNIKSDLWLSSVYKTGKHGGVFVTKDGTIPFVSGTSTPEIIDYSVIPCETVIATGDDINVTFTLSLPNFTYYNPLSIDMQVNGVSINLTALGDPIEVLTSTPDVGTGTYNTSTGLLTFTFDTAPIKGDVITVSYTINLLDEIYFTLFSKDQQADDLKVKIAKDTNFPDSFIIYVYRYDPTTQEYAELSDSPINVSVNPLQKDGYENNIYIEGIFDEDTQVLFTSTVQKNVVTTFVNDLISKSLVGGNRGGAIVGADIATAYSNFQDKVKYPTKIIFDVSGLPEVATKFETMRSSTNNRCRFMLPTANLSDTAILLDPLGAANNTDSRGLYYYCLTWAVHKDLYFGKNFACSCMGLVAGRMADVLKLGPGGVPAWIDEDGIGGQLGSSIVKFLQSGVTETNLKLLDEARLNPVVLDPIYGPMIISWRTRQSKMSDYSWIGQSSIADLTVEEIEEKVLPLQITKLIDNFHMSQVKMKAEQLVSAKNKWISSFLVVCDDTNNTAITKQNQQFILDVYVQLTPYSNTIKFSFINTPQGKSIEESIAK